MWCMGIIAITIIPFFYYFHGNPSDNIADWASFATYLGLSLSLISVFFIFLTYRSQTNMSTVLQFESTFFQWFHLHRQLCGELSKEIDYFADNIALKFIKNESKNFTINKFKNAANDEKCRNIIRYYRDLYQILKYIYLSPILENDEQRKKYYDIVQAQMTDSELITTLFLLLSDKNLKDKRVLKNISFLELADKAHLFKNLYYSKTETNFDNFVSFMRKKFPLTAKHSFHFLIIED